MVDEGVEVVVFRILYGVVICERLAATENVDSFSDQVLSANGTELESFHCSPVLRTLSVSMTRCSVPMVPSWVSPLSAMSWLLRRKRCRFLCNDPIALHGSLQCLSVNTPLCEAVTDHVSGIQPDKSEHMAINELPDPLSVEQRALLRRCPDVLR